MVSEKTKETKWEAIKWEIDWNWNHYISSPIRSFKVGIKNLWTWRKVIYRDQWYDHAFFHRILKKKLETMYKGWVGAWQVGGDERRKEIKELIDILDRIEYLEDNVFTLESGEEISALYTKFGHLLFGVRRHTRYGETSNKNTIIECPLFELLWD